VIRMVKNRKALMDAILCIAVVFLSVMLLVVLIPGPVITGEGVSALDVFSWKVMPRTCTNYYQPLTTEYTTITFSGRSGNIMIDNNDTQRLWISLDGNITFFPIHAKSSSPWIEIYRDTVILRSNESSDLFNLWVCPYPANW